MGTDADGLHDGHWANVTDARLNRTLNVVLRRLARAARDSGMGVWAPDATSQFDLVDQSSISPPNAAVILAKLFRRATDYLKDVTTKGFNGNLADWMRSVSASGTRDENDQVLVCGSLAMRLADLLAAQKGGRIPGRPDRNHFRRRNDEGSSSTRRKAYRASLATSLASVRDSPIWVPTLTEPPCRGRFLEGLGQLLGSRLHASASLIEPSDAVVPTDVTQAVHQVGTTQRLRTLSCSDHERGK